MKRWKRNILRIGCGIGVFFVVLIVAAIIILNSEAFRSQLAHQATLMLSEKLDTHVAIKDADIDLPHAKISLFGVEIEDRQKRKMIQLDHLNLKTQWWPLLFNEVRINDAHIRGLHAQLYKPSTHEPANYQFVIDAFKKEKPSKRKRKLVLNVKKIMVENNSITYNGNHFSLKRLFYRKGHTGRLEEIKTTFSAKDRKGQQHTHQFNIDHIGFSDDIATNRLLNIRGIQYTTDSIKAKADLKMHFHYLDIDSLDATITNLQITEQNSGYHLTNMMLTVRGNKQLADIYDLSCHLKGNNNFTEGTLSLKNAHIEKEKRIDGQSLKADWTVKEKKSDANHHAVVEAFSLIPQKDEQILTLLGIDYKHNTHKPRKNRTGIPDIGNLHVEGDLQLALKQPVPGTTEVTLNQCELTEEFSGMQITDLQLNLTHNKQATLLDGLKVQVENPQMKLDGTLQLDKAQYQKEQLGTIEHLQVQWNAPNARGYKTNHQAQIETILVRNQDQLLKLDLNGLHYATESQQNGNKKTSSKGYPDLQHLDMTAQLHALLDKNTQEDVKLTVTNGQAFDRISGMRVKDLQLKVNINNERTQISQLSTNWSTQDAKGKTDNHFSIADLNIKKLSNQQLISLKGIQFTNNNHQPRKKSEGSTPTLDTGHLNITGNLQMLLNNFGKDTIDFVLTHFDAKEKESGLNIAGLKMAIKSGLKKNHLNGIHGNLTWGDYDANFQMNLKTDKKTKAIEVNALEAQLFNRLNDKHINCSLNKLNLNKDYTGAASNLLLKWNSLTRKGWVDNTVSINNLSMKLRKDDKLLDIGGLRFATNNHQPRKNTGKPKRGFFDANHLDLHSNMTFIVKKMSKDGVTASLTKCNITDEVAGINVKSLLFDADIQKDKAKLKNIRFRLPNSELTSPEAYFQLPNKRKGIPLHYEASQVEGTVLLQDISRTFAPILKGFTLPLHIRTKVSGTNDDMSFDNIEVNTIDEQLKIWAVGNITDMKDKYSLIVRFDVDSMRAIGNSKERIINLFPVKKLMMEQVEALGDISYKGNFQIRWKKEEFFGRLNSSVGPIDFNFGLDEKNKYLAGNLITDSLKFGEVFGVKSVNFMAFKGNFMVDIAKARTAAMRTMRNGKLPIGVANLDVIEARYRIIHIKNLHANISSDGAVAKGRFEGDGKYIDLIGKFAFMRTSTKKKLRFRPGIRFHKRHETYQIQRQQLENQIQENKTPISYVYLDRYEMPKLFK